MLLTGPRRDEPTSASLSPYCDMHRRPHLSYPDTDERTCFGSFTYISSEAQFSSLLLLQYSYTLLSSTLK